MSVIPGSTEAGTKANKPLATPLNADGKPFNGSALTCDGLNTEGNRDETVGVIFTVSLPDGYAIHQGHERTGAWKDGGNGDQYDMMRLGIDRMDGAKAGSQSFEIWFNQADIETGPWSLNREVSLWVAGQQQARYNYRFSKGGSGGGYRHCPRCHRMRERRAFVPVPLCVACGLPLALRAQQPSVREKAWAGTVNTASRMESSGAVGQVNISEAAYEAVKEQAGRPFDFTPRGKVQAKGEVYFVDRSLGKG